MIKYFAVLKIIYIFAVLKQTKRIQQTAAPLIEALKPTAVKVKPLLKMRNLNQSDRLFKSLFRKKLNIWLRFFFEIGLNIFFRMKLDKIIFAWMAKMLVGGNKPQRGKSRFFSKEFFWCIRATFFATLGDFGVSFKLWLWQWNVKCFFGTGDLLTVEHLLEQAYNIFLATT